MTIHRFLTVALFAAICSTATAQPPVMEIVPTPQPILVSQMPVTVPTIDMFAKTFCPSAGKFEVTLIHPKTCCPVTVCFCLPCKEACKVTATKHALRFSYKGKDVVIRFKHDGTVSVRDA
jgi:hypothetical protein